eukprot:gene15008-16716_t
MNILPKNVFLNHILPFLSQFDGLKFIATHHFLFDLLRDEKGIVVLKSAGFTKFFKNESYRNAVLDRVLDSFRQLVLVLNTRQYQNYRQESKEQFLMSMKNEFSSLKLMPEIPLPPLHSLHCDYETLLYLCELYPDCRVSNLSPFTNWRAVYGLKDRFDNRYSEDKPGYYIDHNLASWLSPHLKIVKDELTLRYWPNVMSFEFSSSLHTLHLMFCYVSKLSLVPNIKSLHLDRCNIELLELFKHDLAVLKISQFSAVDLKRIKPCKKLIINQAEYLLNEEELKHYEYLDIKVDTELTLSKFLCRKTRVLKIRNASLNFIPLSSLHVEFQNLKIVELKELSMNSVIDLRLFSMIYELTISGGGKTLSLEGLENVPRVLLKHMPIKSLVGLGYNHYVAVINCGEVTDFSPLKHVREVLIENSQKLIDAKDLCKVHKLNLKGCHKIDSLAGLAEIRELKIQDCPTLSKAIQKLKHDHRIYEKDFGHRVINDPLTKLTDSLLVKLLDYLKSSEKIALISCNCSLYQTLIKQGRHFSITSFKLGSLNSFYRSQLFARIRDPYQQLGILVTYSPNLSNCDYNYLKIVNIQIVPVFIGKVKRLELRERVLDRLTLSDLPQYTTFLSEDMIKFIEEKEVESLILNQINRLEFKLSSSIKELYLQNSTVTKLTVPKSSSLKKLFCWNVLPQNINDFTYLEILTLESIQTSVNNRGDLNATRC